MKWVIFRQLDLQLQAHLEKMTCIITNPMILRRPLGSFAQKDESNSELLQAMMLRHPPLSFVQVVYKPFIQNDTRVTRLL